MIERSLSTDDAIQPPVRPNPTEKRRAMALAAVTHLSRAHPRMAALVSRVGPHRPIITRDPFRSLFGAIVQQQVSMAAARAIQKRLCALCADQCVTPAAVLLITPRRLRSAGLSRQKALYVRDLADHFASGALSSRKLRRMSDDEVIEATTAVNGVGRWTAEMLLIFCLERPDVWPIDDLGIRKAARNFLGLEEFPARPALIDMAESWRPYRSFASWYLWRSLEGPIMPGIRL